MLAKFSLLNCMLFALILVSASCSKKDSTTDTTPGGTNTPGNISITSSSFPSETKVKVGTTVKWTNNDSMAHTVTSDDGTTFDSGNLAVGSAFTYKATVAGTYNYHCNYHGGMTGTLIVEN